MRKLNWISAALTTTGILMASAGFNAVEACTRVLWNDNGVAVLASRNMDWEASSSKPMLTVLPRGMARDGGLMAGRQVVAENPARWTSQYGSVVVTALGVGTADGMNERGLSAHALWLNASDYGPRDASRAGVHVGLWAQYVLDNAASVEEAISLLSEIQPAEISIGIRVPLSLAVEDASGDSAIFEYIEGKLVVHHGREHRVLANDPPYDEQLALLSAYDFTDATRLIPLPGNTNSRDRFVRASFYLDFLRKTKPMTEREAVTSILSVARNLSLPIGGPMDEPGTVDETDYRTVADLTNGRYFFESKKGLAVLWTDLQSLDLRPGAPVLELNPENPELSGDITTKYLPAEKPPFSG